jgi:hypothetical protein
MNNKHAANYGQKVIKIKNFINWQIEVEFKKNAIGSQKTKALIAIDKYILNYLHKQVYSGMLLSIKFSHTSNVVNLPKDNFVIIVEAGLGRGATDAVSTVKPPPPPPIMKVFPAFINNIKNLNIVK